MVLRPHALIPGRKYRLGVIAKRNFTMPGLSETEIITNLPPYGGTCDISPSEGKANVKLVHILACN